jgi:hypothetical protein
MGRLTHSLEISTMTTTTRKRKPAAPAKPQQPVRSLRYVDGILSITQDGTTTSYTLTPVHDDLGGLMQGHLLGVRLAKRGGDEAIYDVDIIDGRCECLGYLRHCKCKHLAAVAKLRDMGRI